MYVWKDEEQVLDELLMLLAAAIRRLTGLGSRQAARERATPLSRQLGLMVKTEPVG